MPNSSSPSNNSNNLSNNPSKTFHAPDQNSWVTMTETTMSEEGDIECTSMSRETDPTSSQASNVPTDHVTSSFTTPKSEASHETSRHSSPETRIPRSSPGVAEKLFRFSSRSECGYDIDLAVEDNPDADDDDDDDEHHYTYTYTSKPSLAHPPHPLHSHPPPSQSSHTPRTPHLLHSLELIDLFPDLKIRDDHLTNYFQNVGFFKDDDMNIPTELESRSKSKSKLHDTLNSESNSDRDPHNPPLSKQSSSSSSSSSGKSTPNNPPQSFTTKTRQNKTTAIYKNMHTHIDQPPQQTNSSMFRIPDIEERDYKQDAAHLDVYPESEFDTSSTSSSSSSSDEKADGC